MNRRDFLKHSVVVVSVGGLGAILAASYLADRPSGLEAPSARPPDRPAPAPSPAAAARPPRAPATIAPAVSPVVRSHWALTNHLGTLAGFTDKVSVGDGE